MEITTAKALSRLAAVRAGKQYRKDDVVDLDGAPATFVWQVLTKGDKQECVAAAHKRLLELELPDHLRHYQDLEDEVATQLLARAMRDPEDPERTFAADAADVRKHLTVDQINLLLDRYWDFEEEVNPDIDSSDFYPAIEAALKKKDRRALMSCGSRALSDYLLTTVSQQSS